MKKIIAILTITLFASHLYSQDFSGYQRTESGVKATVNGVDIELQFYNDDIVRVLKYPAGTEKTEKKSFSVIMTPQKTDLRLTQYNNVITLSTQTRIATLNLLTGDVSFNGIDTRPFISEKNTSTKFEPRDYKSGKSYQIQQTFVIDKQEAVYGLGQHQKGGLNQRGKTIALRQQNMEIAIPIIHSIKGYAVFWDNYSPTTYKDNLDGMTLTSTSGNCMDYYFMYGKTADGTIVQIRLLTGQAQMFPLWTYGFWQSRERYASQQELLDAVKKYRQLGIPLDGIVQDWQYWGTDNKRWNAVKFDNPAFPNPKKMIEEVHKNNAHIAISVWPSFGPETDIHKELKNKGLLFDFDTYPQRIGVKVYNPFNPEARDIYWKYMNKNLFSLGIDGWWLDATEPEDNIGEDSFNESAYLGAYRDVSNAFPLFTVGGVYEHQRKSTSAKRVFILTRSAFAGQQRYAANSWSGDVDSRWSVLRKQIPAGLNFSLCGIPYWNADIGGFWSNRAYPRGLRDKAFHELYVRWLQFAAFTPMMRSHGTNTPREIYQFGEKGDWAFDAQAKYIGMRYRLLPYIYSNAHDISADAGSMMRALFMDFARDAKVRDIDDQYMFGKSLMVAPVTDSMYVSRATGTAVEDFSVVKTRSVYLPGRGSEWYDFHTGKKYAGGQNVDYPCPIDIIPLFVKAGSIIPYAPVMQYATEKQWDNLDLFIFPGSDAEFVLYEDEGDNYNYEKGAFSTVSFKWNDKEQTLTIGDVQGAFPKMLKSRLFNVTIVGESKSVSSESPDKKIKYEGRAITEKL
ncbi:MAG: glycoside hydrolase family 31 protein [Tannerella sp.]|jgi:alpha-D-xyloside xylohydrolase|nr:glycoside hydrolase family 31 protein [Tannerella sp.]